MSADRIDPQEAYRPGSPWYGYGVSPVAHVVRDDDVAGGSACDSEGPGAPGGVRNGRHDDPCSAAGTTGGARSSRAAPPAAPPPPPNGSFLGVWRPEVLLSRHAF